MPLLDQARDHDATNPADIPAAEVGLIRDGLPFASETRDLLARLDTTLPFDQLREPLDLLRTEGQWDRAFAELRSRLDDPTGMAMLACELRCAALTRRYYRFRGIDERIFWDTMGFFPRFVNWHHRHHGTYRFTFASWAPRQLNPVEYRLGQLEFEMVGDAFVNVHVPDDARLETALLADDFRNARRFLAMYYPSHAELPFRCESWLLSPALRTMLPEDSRILAFQRFFTLYATAERNDYKLWMYGREDIADADLPERTSLERAMKRYVRDGNRMTIGYGELDWAYVNAH